MPIESFNDSLRDEYLNEEIFESLADARRKLALWRCDYNHVRPHSSLGNPTPAEARRALEQTGGAAPDALAQPEAAPDDDPVETARNSQGPPCIAVVHCLNALHGAVVAQW